MQITIEIKLHALYDTKSMWITEGSQGPRGLKFISRHRRLNVIDVMCLLSELTGLLLKNNQIINSELPGIGGAFKAM